MTSRSASSPGTVTPPPHTKVHITSNVTPNPLAHSGVVSYGQVGEGVAPLNGAVIQGNFSNLPARAAVNREPVGQIHGVSGSGWRLLDSASISNTPQTDEELFQKVALGRRECLGELVE